MIALSEHATAQMQQTDRPGLVRTGADLMPAFAAIVAALEPSQPLHGARVACTLPHTAGATAVVEALERLGAVVRRVPLAGQQHQASRLLDWPDAAGPNLLLEHGAAVSRLIHAGTRAQGRSPQVDGRSYSAIATLIRGATEVSQAGATWLARQTRAGELLYPAVDCSAAGPFALLVPEDRSLRSSSALALLVLSQVELFADTAETEPGLREPSTSAARTMSNAHDQLLRSRITKLRDASSTLRHD